MHLFCIALFNAFSAQIFALVLIIAVMFTFSFGSAFATADYSKGLANEYFNVAMTAVKEAGGIEVESYKIEYSTLEANRAQLLEAAYAFAKASTPDDEYVKDVAGISAILADDANKDLKMALVAAQYASDKASAIAILNGLSVADYSTAEMDEVDADGCKTYQEHVQFLINDAIQKINDADSFTTDSIVADYVTAKGVIDGYFNEYADATQDKLVVEEGYEGADGEKVGLGVYKLNNNFVVGDKTLSDYTTDAVNAQDAVSAANVAAVKATIASKYAVYLATANADKTFAANMKTVLDFLAEQKVEGVKDVSFDIDLKDAVAKAIADVEEFKASAAQLAAEKDVNGALVRDAEDVADLVTEGTTNAYATSVGLETSARDIDACKAAIKALYASLDSEKLAYAKKIRETYVAEMLSYFEDDEVYYPAELAKLKTLTDEYLAKVNAVTDLTKVGSYDVEYLGAALATADYESSLGTKLLSVETAADVDAKTTSLKTMAHEYVDFLNKQISKTADQYSVANTYAKLDEEIEKLVGNSEARTAKEISALSDQVLALVKQLPTNAAVEAAEDAAADAVKALPTTVTTADKAVIDAAKAALKAYKELTTVDYTNKTAVDTAVTKYAYAYNNEITASVKAVSTTDKAAIKAILSEISAFVDSYGNEAVFNVNKTTLKGYLTKIQQTEAAAVRNAITAIPVSANLTDASKDKVVAARTLYDAYVAEYTDYEDYDYNYTLPVTTDGFVADDFNYSALVNAETALGLNNNEVETAKALLQDINIKARSTRVTKGIKVTVTADVSALEAAGFTVEYKFYRSTKKSSGYVYKLTSKTGSYTNTAGTKGVKYYYKAKIVVKNAAGEVLAESPIKMCSYACRTWTK